MMHDEIADIKSAHDSEEPIDCKMLSSKLGVECHLHCSCWCVCALAQEAGKVDRECEQVDLRLKHYNCSQQLLQA